MLGSIYDTALAPQSWPGLLRQLAKLFDCHFADNFARTDDRSVFHGEAIGLDAADYQQEFLGLWTPRNVWRCRRPVLFAGEVLTTQEIVPKAELVRSEMFVDYLDRRELHQGLRLATWKGEGWINAISLMRSWSRGQFSASELSTARFLVPHLQRSVAIARELTSPGEKKPPPLDCIDQPALVVDAKGHILRMNARADEHAVSAVGLLVRMGEVCLAEADSTNKLLTAVARAATFPTQASTLSFATSSGAAPLRISVLPVSSRAAWPVPEVGSVLILLSGQAPVPATAEWLRKRYGFTPTELTVALQLRDGLAPAAVASHMGRSMNTVRTHVAQLLHKTDTKRQADLIRLLLHRD